MHAFVGHAFGHAQSLAHRAERIAIPVKLIGNRFARRAYSALRV